MTRTLLVSICASLLLFNVQTAIAGTEYSTIQPTPITEFPKHGAVSAAQMEQIGQQRGFCAITFDDGPSQNTEAMLELLRERGVHATFFLLGSKIRRNPAMVKRLVEEGHEVANHTTSHQQLSKLSANRQFEEMKQVQDLFASLGVEGYYVRPPYGSFNKRTVEEADKLGLDLVLWTVDTNDWRHPLTVEGMCTRHGYTKPSRGVFLMHDTHKSTLEGLPNLLDYLDSTQCRYVTISEYLGRVPVPDAAPAAQQPQNPAQPAPQSPAKQPGTATPQPAPNANPNTAPAVTPASPAPAGTPSIPAMKEKAPNGATLVPEIKQPLKLAPEQANKEKEEKEEKPSFFRRLFHW